MCKVFHGSGYSQLVEAASRTSFRVVKPIKPKASRDKSAETFLVGIGLKTRWRPWRDNHAVKPVHARVRIAPGSRGLTRLKSAAICRGNGRQWLSAPLS